MPAGTGRAVSHSCWDRASAAAATLPGQDGLPVGQRLPSPPASSPGRGLRLGQSHGCVFPPRRKDHIVMVNGLSMENVSSSFAIQTLKTCGKTANIVSVPRGGTGASVAHGTALCLSPSQLPCPTQPVVPVWGLEIAVETSPGRDSCTHHPLLLIFHLQTLKRSKKVHLPASKSSPASPAAPRRCDSDEDCGLHGADPALHRSRDDLDHSQGYDGDSSSERSSGHHRDDRRHHRSVARSRRRSQDSSHWRQSPGSGSDRRGYSRHRSANGFGHGEDTNGLALVSGFKRLPRQDVLAKPITSVLVKQKQDEGEAPLLPLSLGLLVSFVAVCPLGGGDGRAGARVCSGERPVRAVLGAPNPPGLSPGLQNADLGLATVPRGARTGCGDVGRGDLEGVQHLPGSGTAVGSLWCRVRPEAGKSALHQAHSGERAGGEGRLLAGGRSHPEGTGPTGRTALLGIPPTPAGPLAGVTAGDEPRAGCEGWQLGCRQLPSRSWGHVRALGTSSR